MIDLPDYPSPASAEVGLIDFGAFLMPALGGPVQRVERMGNRFRISVSMPPMPGAKLGRQWVSKLIQGKQQGARMALPMQGFDPGLPGTPTVDGAGQSGRSLAIKDGRPGYVFRDGQFFSIVTAGTHRVHLVTAEAIVGSNGKVTLAVEPMLRVSPANNDVLAVAKPMIEGFIAGDEQMWSLSLAGFIGIGFDLAESS